MNVLLFMNPCWNTLIFPLSDLDDVEDGCQDCSTARRREGDQTEVCPPHLHPQSFRPLGPIKVEVLQCSGEQSVSSSEPD